MRLVLTNGDGDINYDSNDSKHEGRGGEGLPRLNTRVMNVRVIRTMVKMIPTTIATMHRQKRYTCNEYTCNEYTELS